MTFVSEVVGRIAADRIKKKIDLTRERDLKQMTRVSSIQLDEVGAAVEKLSSWAAEHNVALVVISKKAWDGFDPDSEHALMVRPWWADYGEGPETSPAEFRNFSIDQHCVFFEVDEYEEKQSFKNVPCLRDGDLLEDSGLVALEALWEMRRDQTSAPSTVKKAIKEVFEVCNESGGTIALRPWVRFIENLMSGIGETGAIDASTIRTAVGGALPELRLFTDSDLSEFGGEAPRRRRLKENVLASLDKTPSGREIDEKGSDELLTILDDIEFKRYDGTGLEQEESEAVRESIRGYLGAHHQVGPEHVIELTHWKQLFQRMRVRRGIGTRIHEELDANHPDRLPEFEELQSTSRLDDKEIEAAQEFLDLRAEVETAPNLADLISRPLHKAVVRIANPKAQATNQPLRHLLRLLYSLIDEDAGQEGTIRLEVRRSHGSDDDSDKFSRALFALLYGPTLRDVVDSSKDLGIRLEIESSLLECGLLNQWFVEEVDPEEDQEIGWDPLRLQLRWADEKAVHTFFEWRPAELAGFVAIGAVLSRPSAQRWTSDSDFDLWCSGWLEEGGTLASAVETEAESALVKEWLAHRKEWLKDLFENGLKCDVISRYFATWESLLERLFNDYVPSGVSFPDVGEFLKVDTYTDSDGTPTLLATHPIRMRWIQSHLLECRDRIVDVLNGQLKLNPINDELFFDRLVQLSPHEQPPLLSDENRTFVAVREFDWHERYEIVTTSGEQKMDWLADLDDASLDELSGALGSYVDAHPYTDDGLALLIAVREGGARTVRRILKKFRAQRGLRGRRDRMLLTLHILCPAAEYGSVSDMVSELDDPSARTERDFPRIRVVFHKWERSDSFPPLESIEPTIDVALVPNVFSSYARFQEATQDLDQRKGRFDPWVDRAVTREPGGRTGDAAKTVTRALLPEARDSVLAWWSTVNIRHFRGSPVGEAGPSSVDFAQLMLSVVPGEVFFSRLHKVANWVVTLDAFIGRDQIEALNHGPEVISVKSGLGKGSAYTLVISSQAGRGFILNRLEQRLIQQLGQRLELEAGEIAEAIYDQARELAAKTLLRATGIGRTAQELVGLIASRQLALEFQGSDSCEEGFEAWIALDEWPEWFSGGSDSRADLLRVRGCREEEVLRLSFTVVEAKLRKATGISAARQQVKRTVELFQSAMAPSDDEVYDGRFWRRELLRALKETARPKPGEKPVAFQAFSKGQERDELSLEVQAAIRDGDYELEGVEGVICTMSDDGVEDQKTTEEGFLWIRASLDEVARVLEGALHDDVGTQIGRRSETVARAARSLENTTRTMLDEAGKGGDAMKKRMDKADTREVGEEDSVTEVAPETKGLTVRLAVAMGLDGDNKLTKKEATLINEWMAKQVELLDEGAREPLKDFLNTSFLEAYKAGELGTEAIESSARRLAEIGNQEDRDTAVALCTAVKFTDGVIDPLEHSVIQLLTDAMDIEADDDQDPGENGNEPVDEIIDVPIDIEPENPVVTPSVRERIGLGEQILVEKYQTLLDVFSEIDVDVKRDDNPYQEGPGYIVYRVRPGPGVTSARLKSKAVVEHVQLRMELSAEQHPRAFVDRGAVQFEVPKQESERYYVSADDLWSRVETPEGRLEVAIGENISGEPVIVDFSSSNTPHLLIGGITGSGKSVALETILVGLTRAYTPEQLQLFLVDPKGTELTFLEDDPHVPNGHIGIYPEDAIGLLEDRVEEMQRRYRLMSEKGVRHLGAYNGKVDLEERLPWQLVVLDEFADLTSDREEKREIERQVQRLAQKARAVWIHVIVATQKPSAEVISTVVRSNLGAQLALRVKTASDSRIIMDDPGAEALAGNGDAFLKTSRGGLTRLQCAMVKK
jgi:hypothetical protein